MKTQRSPLQNTCETQASNESAIWLLSLIQAEPLFGYNQPECRPAGIKRPVCFQACSGAQAGKDAFRLQLKAHIAPGICRSMKRAAFPHGKTAQDKVSGSLPEGRLPAAALQDERKGGKSCTGAGSGQDGRSSERRIGCIRHSLIGLRRGRSRLACLNRLCQR